VTPRDLDLLSTIDLQQIEFLAMHLDEIMHGIPLPMRETARAEYDLTSTTSESRRVAKARELREMGWSMSEITLKRKMAAYNRYGPAGLIDRRMMISTLPLAGADQRMVEVIRVVLDRSIPSSTVTRARIRYLVELEFAKRFPGLEIPQLSASTFGRYLAALGKGRYYFGNAQTRRTAANGRGKRSHARWAVMPGEEVQIDTTHLDVFILDANARPKKVDLTIMIDKATHSIVGFGFAFTGTKGVDHSVMLAHSMSPRRLLPNARGFRTDELAEMPWTAHIAETDRAIDTERPFIRTIRMMTDNGADYRSTVFVSTAKLFGTSITRSSTKTATNKAMVERAFGSIKTQFVQHLPGFTGGAIGSRGEDPSKDPDLFDIFSLTEAFDAWITCVWQNLETDALKDLVSPGKSHSPNQMYRAMYEMTGFSPQPVSDIDFAALLPIEPRTIQNHGIQIGYRMYDSPELDRYRLAARGDGSAVLWPIRWDPRDPMSVWFEDPEGDGWIEIPWKNADLFTKPFSRDMRRQLRIVREALPALDDGAGLALSVEIIGRVPTFRTRVEAERSRNEAALQLREYVGAPRRRAGTVEVESLDGQEEETEQPVRQVGRQSHDQGFDEIQLFEPRGVVSWS
jgi:hypothetical protein